MLELTHGWFISYLKNIIILNNLLYTWSSFHSTTFALLTYDLIIEIKWQIIDIGKVRVKGVDVLLDVISNPSFSYKKNNRKQTN